MSSSSRANKIDTSRLTARRLTHATDLTDRLIFQSVSPTSSTSGSRPIHQCWPTIVANLARTTNAAITLEWSYDYHSNAPTILWCSSLLRDHSLGLQSASTTRFPDSAFHKESFFDGSPGGAGWPQTIRMHGRHNSNERWLGALGLSSHKKKYAHAAASMASPSSPHRMLNSARPN